MLALYTVKSVNTARVPRSIHSLLLRSAIVARLKLRFVPRFWVKPPPAYRARDPGWVEPSNSSEVWKFQLWKKNRTNHIQNLTSHEYAHVYVTNVWLETFLWHIFTFLYKGRKMTKESKSQNLWSHRQDLDQVSQVATYDLNNFESLSNVFPWFHQPLVVHASKYLWDLCHNSKLNTTLTLSCYHFHLQTVPWTHSTWSIHQSSH